MRPEKKSKRPLNIAVNGKAHVCCFDYNKEMVVGDINKQSISEILWK